MKHLFTSEKKRPSAKTIYVIKKLANKKRAFDKDKSKQANYVNKNTKDTRVIKTKRKEKTKEM